MASFQSYIYAIAVLGTSLCFLHPLIIYLQDPLLLRRFPKPNFTAGMSSLWLARITWSQKRSRILHEHFQKLGDVIRVAPNHIIFNTPEAIKDIYGVLALTRGVVKDELYDRMAGDGAHDLVQLRDRNEHSSRRKAIANAFAAKTVVNMEPVIGKAVAQLIENLDGFVEEKRAVNIRYW
jgi:benzoate 4-monooxygenase